jgi:uncharacterized membrane protein
MKTSSELRALARADLKGSWLQAVGITLLYSIIAGAANIVPGVGPLIITGPLTLGLCGYYLKKARKEPAIVEDLFGGFQRFAASLVLFLLEALFIFLWSLLFIVPGIIKSLSYSMAFFILRDNPDMKGSEAITASRNLMNGHKMRLFLLGLSFIGWSLLCCLTLGIGFLWLCPYIVQSIAHFYEDLKQNQPASGR